MCDEYDEDKCEVTFTSNSKLGGVTSYVNRTISGEDAYPEIVQEFVWFLNSIGYNYIGGLVVLDEKGATLHTTDL